MIKKPFEVVLNANLKDLNPSFFGCSFTKHGYTNRMQKRTYATVYYVMSRKA